MTEKERGETLNKPSPEPRSVMRNTINSVDIEDLPISIGTAEIMSQMRRVLDEQAAKRDAMVAMAKELSDMAANNVEMKSIASRDLSIGLARLAEVIVHGEPKTSLRSKHHE